MNSISTYIPDKRTKTIAIAIIGGVFCIFGFVSYANARLIPFFKIARELTSFQSYFVIFSFYIAYFAMDIPSKLVTNICGHMLGIILIPKYVLKKNAHVFLHDIKQVFYKQPCDT